MHRDEWTLRAAVDADVDALMQWFPEHDDVNTWGRGMTQAERLEAAVQVLTDAGYTWTTPPQALRDDSGRHVRGDECVEGCA